IDSDVRVRWLASRSAIWRLTDGSTPGTGPVPATGAIGLAYGLMLRWCRIVANQPTRCTTSSGLQASAATATRAATAAGAEREARGLRTAHPLRPRAAEQGLDLTRPRRLARHEDAEPVVREARVVGDRPQAARREQRVEQDPEDGRERAEQDRHLAHDHDVRRGLGHRPAAQTVPHAEPYHER